MSSSNINVVLWLQHNQRRRCRKLLLPCRMGPGYDEGVIRAMVSVFQEEGPVNPRPWLASHAVTDQVPTSFRSGSFSWSPGSWVPVFDVKIGNIRLFVRYHTKVSVRVKRRIKSSNSSWLYEDESHMNRTFALEHLSVQ